MIILAPVKIITFHLCEKIAEMNYKQTRKDSVEIKRYVIDYIELSMQIKTKNDNKYLFDNSDGICFHKLPIYYVIFQFVLNKMAAMISRKKKYIKKSENKQKEKRIKKEMTHPQQMVHPFPFPFLFSLNLSKLDFSGTPLSFHSFDSK